MIKGRKANYTDAMYDDGKEGEVADSDFSRDKYNKWYNHQAEWVRVVVDPSGDFAAGTAEFMKQQFADGLKKKVWPLGMIVSIAGEKYEVVKCDPKMKRCRAQALRRLSDGKIIRL